MQINSPALGTKRTLTDIEMATIKHVNNYTDSFIREFAESYRMDDFKIRFQLFHQKNPGKKDKPLYNEIFGFVNFTPWILKETPAQPDNTYHELYNINDKARVEKSKVELAKQMVYLNSLQGSRAGTFGFNASQQQENQKYGEQASQDTKELDRTLLQSKVLFNEAYLATLQSIVKNKAQIIEEVKGKTTALPQDTIVAFNEFFPQLTTTAGLIQSPTVLEKPRPTKATLKTKFATLLVQ